MAIYLKKTKSMKCAWKQEKEIKTFYAENFTNLKK